MGVFARIGVSLVLTLSLFSPAVANPDLNVPPKRVSAELWNSYRETALFSIDGIQRNLRWTTSPRYFVKGDPSSSDIDTLNKVLYTIGEHCDNIKPGRTVQEPQEGVIFNFIKPSDFKSVIKDTPDDIKDSYLYWTYFINRGLTKTDVVISTEITDKLYRDYLIRVRVLQGFGFHNLTENENFNFFARTYGWENTGTITKQDRELLGFYCSTYVQAWNTDLQTQQLINSANLTLSNSAPNFENRSTVTITNFGATVEIHPRGDQIISNKVSQILLQVKDRAGAVVKNEEIDLSSDAYSIRTINFTGLEKKTSYNAVIYNRNSAGYGIPQQIPFRTGEITTSGPVETSAARDALLEAEDAFNASLDAYQLVLEAKITCLKTFQSANPVERQILDLVLGTKICTSEDSEISTAYESLLALQPATTNVKDILVLIDKLNALTDTFNMFAETMDTGTVFAEEIRDLAESLNLVENKLMKFEYFPENLEVIVEKLPLQIRNVIVSKTELTAYEALFNSYEIARDSFEKSKSQFSGLSEVNFDALQKFGSSLNITLRSLPDEDLMSSSLNRALKAIPPYYCKKGKKVSLPKKANCSIGFKKVKINKEY